MMRPKWQILIPTVVNREQQFARLRDCLAPQVAKYHGDVEVVVFWNNYERELSQLRQLMIETATAEYVNFIDDDDLVADDYVDTIFPLLDGVDYIGFKLDFYSNGRKNPLPVIHSLTCEGWYDNGEGFFRRGTLINPTKRELMLEAGFTNSDYRKGVPEDITYAVAVDQLLKTEHFIDKPMHIYLQTDAHAWSRFEPEYGIWKRPELPPYFRFHKNSTKESISDDV